MTRAGSFYILQRKQSYIREGRIDKTKGFGLGVVNSLDIPRKIKVGWRRFVCMDFLAPDSPSLVVRISSHLLLLIGYFSLGRFMTCFREEV